MWVTLPIRGDLQGDGSGPVSVYMRLPPDIYLEGEPQNLSYHMDYRYNGIPLANESTLQVYMNNSAYVSSTPLPHTENGIGADRDGGADPKVRHAALLELR